MINFKFDYLILAWKDVYILRVRRLNNFDNRLIRVVAPLHAERAENIFPVGSYTDHGKAIWSVDNREIDKFTPCKNFHIKEVVGRRLRPIETNEIQIYHLTVLIMDIIWLDQIYQKKLFFSRLHLLDIVFQVDLKFSQ
jgi:hypothetical protein